MLKIFKRLVIPASEYKWRMLMAIFLGFMTVGSSVGLMMTSAFIIAKAALHPSIAEISVAVVGVRFFGVARGVFRYLERLVSHDVTFRLLAAFRVWFYKAIEPLAPARLFRFKSGDLLTRMVSDIESLEHIYIRVLAPPAVAFLVSLLMWFLFGMYNILFSIILVSFLLISGIGLPLISYFLKRKIGSKVIRLRSELNALAIDSIRGQAEILAFGQGENYSKKYISLNQQFTKAQKQLSQTSGLMEALTTLFMNLAVFSILYVAIPFVENSLLDGVYLSVLVIGTMAAFEAIIPLPEAALHFEKSVQSARRVFNIMDSKPEVDESESYAQTGTINDEIIIKNLSFAYAENLPVYSGLNLEIKRGVVNVLVGVNGSGKSTLINLLLRFWDYKSGNILIGKDELKSCDANWVRKQIAIVSQNTHLFNGTMKDNILLAKEGASQDEIISATQKAQIHAFIKSLPNGYDTWIGEQGLLLSGGERQRLSIARALLKDAPLMIFDEPTANLDPENEQNILQMIKDFSVTKTVLMITHRLTTLDNFDSISVLANGKIIEHGSHQFLLDKKGYYDSLYDIQKNISF